MAVKKKWIEITCKVCNKTFKVKPYREKTARFCSHRCGNIVKAKMAGQINIDRLRGKGKKHPYVKYYGRHMHRVVAEEMLGRKLTSKEIVHHIDGDPKNNAPENLLVTNRRKHAEIHNALSYVPPKTNIGECTVDGCTGQQECRHLCHIHYGRWYLKEGRQQIATQRLSASSS